MTGAADAEFMERALMLAARGRGRTSPNPMVGAVVVAGGEVVGAAYHQRAGTAHAEVHALAVAGERARGATLYCTLEPCAHTGRTGPCVERIVRAGIVRVVAALEDPNPLVSGRGFGYLRAHGVAVAVGVGAAAAERLNEAFITRMHTGRPFVILKVALSRDGCIAARPGQRTKLTGHEADRVVHGLRAEVDAIAIGSGTLLADDPVLTSRGLYRPRPITRVVFDGRLRTPVSAQLLSTLDAGPVIIVTTEAQARTAGERVEALTAAGATVEALPERGLGPALARLAEGGVVSLLLEGGAAVHAAALQDGLVDRVQAWMAPVDLGSAGLPWVPGGRALLAALRERREVEVGRDVLIEGYVQRNR